MAAPMVAEPCHSNVSSSQTAFTGLHRGEYAFRGFDWRTRFPTGTGPGNGRAPCEKPQTKGVAICFWRKLGRSWNKFCNIFDAAVIGFGGVVVIIGTPFCIITRYRFAVKVSSGYCRCTLLYSQVREGAVLKYKRIHCVAPLQSESMGFQDTLINQTN